MIFLIDLHQSRIFTQVYPKSIAVFEFHKLPDAISWNFKLFDHSNYLWFVNNDTHSQIIGLNPFSANILFLYTLKTSGKQR